MQINDPGGQRQPQAAARDAARIRAPVQLFENVRQVIRGDARATIGNLDHQVAAILTRPDLHGGSLKVASRQGERQGTVFSMVLPAGRNP